MKKLLTTGLLVFLIATTFLSDNPPGWYQQQLPVNDVVTDISFTDSLNGWIITDGSFNNNDTGYIMRTTNGGVNWTVQFDSTLVLNVIEFVDENIGYAGGGSGRAAFLKTTNGGIEWKYSVPFGSEFYSILDLKFISRDTGWICSDASLGGGVFKTTDGGTSWQRQTTATQLRPIKLFFINNETGWALNTPNNSIYKTTNGGINWLFLNGISSGLKDLFFLNNDTGWIIRLAGQNSILKTTTGGLSWFVQYDPTPFGSVNENIFIINNSNGWIASSRFTILSLANDSTWGNQAIPSGFPAFKSIFMIDTVRGYSGGTIFVKTDDGGGIITNIENYPDLISESFSLFQNYPNPFNPSTAISYRLTESCYIQLKIFDMAGKELLKLVDKKQNAGSYVVQFDGADLSSGVYFYMLEANDESGNRLFSKTKKMMLIR